MLVKILLCLVGIISFLMKCANRVSAVFVHYSLLFVLVQLVIAGVITFAIHIDDPTLPSGSLFWIVYTVILLYTHSMARRFHIWLMPVIEILFVKK